MNREGSNKLKLVTLIIAAATSLLTAREGLSGGSFSRMKLRTGILQQVRDLESTKIKLRAESREKSKSNLEKFQDFL